MNRREPINFEWKYSDNFREEYLSPAFDDSSFETVDIPHSNIEVPANNFDEEIYQFESCYRKTISIGKLEKDEMLFIHFEGVMVYAKVYLNGRLMGEHKGGYTEFRINLTPAVIEESDNVLAVYVDSRERSDTPPFGYIVDFLTFGGIYREVALEYRHAVHIEAALIKPRNVLTESPSIDVDLYLSNSLELREDIAAEFVMSFKGEEVISCPEIIRLDGSDEQLIRCSIQVPGPELWDIENPNLYEMEILLFEEGNEIDRLKIRFGFREIAFREEGFILNGREVKIRGLNRHQSFPYAGYAMPRSAQYKDAEILKNDLGVNAVRLSHYPQSRHFLDRCDELGLLVFDEIPGWQHIGDRQWQEISLRNVSEMIKSDGNHPSVIIWGVRINESQDNDDFYSRTNSLAREMDDSRPTGGVRCFTGSSLLEDVYTYNDFSHSGNNKGLIKPKQARKERSPYLVTEHNGHMFPTKKFDDEAHRLSQAKRHLKVLDSMYGEKGISGAFGWCMFDYYTHRDFGSGDKICYHGVMDMFRIPKLAAAVYASQQDETPVLEVASSMNIGENEGSFLGDVYIFTNCDYIRMHKNGEYVRDFYPRRDLYPHIPHPPVIVDDFLGDAIEKNESFSKRDAATVKDLLMKVSRQGENLGLIDTVRMGILMVKRGMNYQQAEDLYTKYFGGWGGQATAYTFTGYKDGQPVKTVEKNQDAHVRLAMELDSISLKEEDTWDSVRCTVRLMDGDDNEIVYANDAFTVETEGPIQIIGPRTISLIGGSIAFWARTSGASGTGRIRISSERFGSIERDITVTKEARAGKATEASDVSV